MFLFDPCNHSGMMIITMGIQTLIIFLSLVSFVPDQKKADILYQKYSLAQEQYQIAKDKDGFFPSSMLYSSPVSASITKPRKDKYDKTGKFSVGVESGYSRIVYCYMCDLDPNTAVIGINGGYWISNRIWAGLDFLYHIPYKSTDQDGGPDVGLISIVPQIKFCILKGIITPTLGLGFGAAISYSSGASAGDGEDVTYLLNFNGGVEAYINEFFSAGINLTYNVLPDWWEYGPRYLTLNCGLNLFF